MKPLNKKAEVIFNKLMAGLTKVGDHKKIDNSNGSFMPVCIEIIDETKAGKIVSVAHYHEVNSDLCRDPDCTFLLSDGTFTLGKVGVFPISFRQDNLGIDQEAATVKEDGHILMFPNMQRDIATFCCQWMLNIQEQQDL